MAYAFRHINSARECEPWVVSRSGRRTRSLPVLGRQGLVGSNLAQSERTSTIARSRWRRDAQQGGQPYGQGVQPARYRWPARVRPVPYGQDYGNAYANYQELEKKKSPIGWWIAGAALVIVIIVVAVLAIRAVTGGDTGTTGGPVGQPSQDFCPPENTASPEAPASSPGRRTRPRRPGFLPPARPAVGAAARSPKPGPVRNRRADPDGSRPAQL